jgi:hypothetical protein
LGYDEAAIETLLSEKIISVEKLKTK